MMLVPAQARTLPRTWRMPAQARALTRRGTRMIEDSEAAFARGRGDLTTPGGFRSARVENRSGVCALDGRQQPAPTPSDTFLAEA